LANAITNFQLNFQCSWWLVDCSQIPTSLQQEIWANAHETCESLWQFLFAANIGLYLPVSISSHFTLLQPKIIQNH